MTDAQRKAAQIDIIVQVRRLLDAGLTPPFVLLTDGFGHYRVTVPS